MITITKKDDRNIGIKVDDSRPEQIIAANTITAYSGESNNVYIRRCIKPNDILCYGNPTNFSVDGETYETKEDLVLALNSFIGNFNSGAATSLSTPQGTFYPINLMGLGIMTSRDGNAGFNNANLIIKVGKLPKNKQVVLSLSKCNPRRKYWGGIEPGNTYSHLKLPSISYRKRNDGKGKIIRVGNYIFHQEPLPPDSTNKPNVSLLAYDNIVEGWNIIPLDGLSVMIGDEDVNVSVFNRDDIGFVLVDKDTAEQLSNFIFFTRKSNKGYFRPNERRV